MSDMNPNETQGSGFQASGGTPPEPPVTPPEQPGPSGWQASLDNSTPQPGSHNPEGWNPQAPQPPQPSSFGAPGTPAQGEYQPIQGDGIPLNDGQPGADPQQSLPGEQQPYGAPPPYPSATPPQPPKKKSKMVPAIASVVSVLVVLGVLGAVFFNPLMRTFMPEQYFKKAWANTAAAFGESAQWPDFASFSGKPFSAEVDVVVNDFGDSAYAPKKVTFSMVTKAHMEDRKLWADISVGADGASYNDNQVYISEDEIAISIPALYKRYDYITINPETFARDWNNSEYGEYDELPSDFDLQEMIVDFFALYEGKDTDSDDLLEYYEAIEEAKERFVSRGTFSEGGSTKITLDSGSTPVTLMTYSFSSQATEEFYTDLLEVFRDFAINRYVKQASPMMGARYYYYDADEFAEELDDMIYEMRKIRFPRGVDVNFYINNSSHLINRTDSENLVMGYQGEEETVRFDFELDLLGGKQLADKFRSDLTIVDPDGDSYHVRLNRNAENSRDVVNDRLTFEFVDYDGETTAFAYRFKWDKGTGGNNMTLELSYDDYYMSDSYRVVLNGNLKESSSEISLRDGRIEFLEGNTTVLGASVEYSLKSIKADELEINLSDSISFFEVNLDDFQFDGGSATPSFAALDPPDTPSVPDLPETSQSSGLSPRSSDDIEALLSQAMGESSAPDISGPGSTSSALQEIIEEAEEEIDDLREAFGDMLDITLTARGSSLVYSYVYKLDIGDDLSSMKEILDSSLDSMSYIFEDLAQELESAGVENASVVVEYYTQEGRLITSKEYY